MVKQPGRKFLSRKTIKNHWASRFHLLGGGFDSLAEFMHADYCWACGMICGDPKVGWTERAHILARCEGGTDDAENIHLLCPTCHKDSEFLSGEEYWAWLRNRENMDSLESAMNRAVYRTLTKGEP